MKLTLRQNRGPFFNRFRLFALRILKYKRIYNTEKLISSNLCPRIGHFFPKVTRRLLARIILQVLFLFCKFGLLIRPFKRLIRKIKIPEKILRSQESKFILKKFDLINQIKSFKNIFNLIKADFFKNYFLKLTIFFKYMQN